MRVPALQVIVGVNKYAQGDDNGGAPRELDVRRIDNTMVLQRQQERLAVGGWWGTGRLQGWERRAGWLRQDESRHRTSVELCLHGAVPPACRPTCPPHSLPASRACGQRATRRRCRRRWRRWRRRRTAATGSTT